MNVQRWIRLSAVYLLVFAATVMLAFGEVAGPFQGGPPKLQQVDGTVTVNERPAVNGAEIPSGAVIHTQQNSSAVVSLAKLGRVEVFEETTMTLTFTDSTATVSMLESGRVRVASSSAVVTTNDGTVTPVGRAMFTVNTTCGNTFVAVSTGNVELRAGNTVKQIAAGSQDSAGQARPGCTPQ